MRQRILPALLGIMVVATCLWVFATHRSALFGTIRNAGAWGPVLYLLCYVVLTAAFVPAGPLTLLGGALFGVAEGAALAFSGAMLASWVAFFASRYLARHAVIARVEQSPRLSKVVTAVSHEGRRVVFLLRVSPVIPFSLINVASGITTISFTDFAVAGVGMIPVSLLYAYYGRALGELAALSGHGHPRDAAHYALLGVGLVATLVVTVIVGRIARRELSV